MISAEVFNEISAAVESDIMSRIEEGTRNGLQALALIAQTNAQQRILRGPKTGRWYGNHRASAPGQAPANDTGFLVGSLRINVTQQLGVDLRALAPYAIHLEYGTRNMRPRPFLRISAEEAGQRSQEVFDAYIGQALR